MQERQQFAKNRVFLAYLACIRRFRWYEKTRVAWLPDGEKKIKDIFIRFGTIH